MKGEEMDYWHNGEKVTEEEQRKRFKEDQPGVYGIGTGSFFTDQITEAVDAFDQIANTGLDNGPGAYVEITRAQLQKMNELATKLEHEGHTIDTLNLWVPEEGDYEDRDVIEVTFELRGDGSGNIQGSTWPIAADGSLSP